MKYRNIDRNFRSTVTVAYRYITYNIYNYIYIYRENVALKSQVWGSLTLAQLEECKALWGSPDRIVDMNLMAHGHILYYLDLMQYT